MVSLVAYAIYEFSFEFVYDHICKKPSLTHLARFSSLALSKPNFEPAQLECWYEGSINSKCPTLSFVKNARKM